MAKLNYDELLCFILLYTAKADYKINREEQEFILRKIDKKTYDRLNERMEDMSDYDILQEILSYEKEHFPNTEGKEKLIQDIRMLFHADGEFDLLEENMLIYIRKLIRA